MINKDNGNVIYFAIEVRNLYIYSYRIKIGRIAKFEMICPSNTKIIFPLFFPSYVTNKNI
jgi:hypothetical protein